MSSRSIFAKFVPLKSASLHLAAKGTNEFIGKSAWKYDQASGLDVTVHAMWLLFRHTSLYNTQSDLVTILSISVLVVVTTVRPPRSGTFPHKQDKRRGWLANPWTSCRQSALGAHTFARCGYFRATSSLSVSPSGWRNRVMLRTRGIRYRAGRFSKIY